MAITITANDANRDGTGINFTSYLANYSRKFVRDGYGEFNDDTMSGSQYATKDTSGWGAVLVAGATRWEYDLATHVVTGSLATVAFGTSVALNNSTERFTYTLDVQISGLGISDKNLGGDILADIMDGNTNSLEARLKLDSLVFKGSTGNDTFSGFGRNDVISGNGGNDTLTGGGGKDTFVFVKNGGNDTVTDFKAGAAKVDVLRVDDSVLRNFDAVLAHADDVKAGVMIDYGKGSILLKGLDVDDLHANDFFFF